MGREAMCLNCFVGVSRTQPALFLKVYRVMVANTCLLRSNSEAPFAFLQCLTVPDDPAVWNRGSYGALASGGLWKELSMWSGG